MPLVAHSNLPTFKALKDEGRLVLDSDRAAVQVIRELHIGFLNMMPDKALLATERQFFRLIGESNQIAQFHIHPFTLPEIQRDDETKAYVGQYYEPFEKLKDEGLDALIITGANVTDPDLTKAPFWEPLQAVTDWAGENVTSTLCSCLASHAIMQFRYGTVRRPLPLKRWGVYSHRVQDRNHPLVKGVNTVFDVPHSRFNEIGRDQFETAGCHVLVESAEAGVHLATSPDGFRFVYMQGHPEYDAVSLLKEYKREIDLFMRGERADYPPFPEHYFSVHAKFDLEKYARKVLSAREKGVLIDPVDEGGLLAGIENTWRDTAKSIVGNWIGKAYQLTGAERKKPFMDTVDPEDPFGRKAA